MHLFPFHSDQQSQFVTVQHLQSLQHLSGFKQQQLQCPWSVIGNHPWALPNAQGIGLPDAHGISVNSPVQFPEVDWLSNGTDGSSLFPWHLCDFSEHHGVFHKEGITGCEPNNSACCSIALHSHCAVNEMNSGCTAALSPSTPSEVFSLSCSCKHCHWLTH